MRKLVEKGGANGLRPCRGNRAGKRQNGQRAAAPGMEGRGGSSPGSPLSLAPWEAAPAALAWSQGSFVLQEKLCLPAVASLMLQTLCKTACWKGCVLGEAALQVWRRSLEVASALQSSRDADCAKIHTLAYLHQGLGSSGDTPFLGLLSRVLCFLFVLPWHAVPKLLVQLPLLVSCKERLAALCPYSSLIYPALGHRMLFSSRK